MYWAVGCAVRLDVVGFVAANMFQETLWRSSIKYNPDMELHVDITVTALVPTSPNSRYCENCLKYFQNLPNYFCNYLSKPNYCIFSLTTLSLTTS
jgi:hypothetical protein